MSLWITEARPGQNQAGKALSQCTPRNGSAFLVSIMLTFPINKIVKFPPRSRKHLDGRSVKSSAISEFLLHDLGHLGLGDHPQDLVSVLASDQALNPPLKKKSQRAKFCTLGYFLTNVFYPLLFLVHPPLRDKHLHGMDQRCP